MIEFDQTPSSTTSKFIDKQTMEKSGDFNLNKCVISDSSNNHTDSSIFLTGEVLKGFRTASYTPMDIVKILLRERAMKQTDLASKIGLDKSSLNNYLSGRFACPTQIKLKISQALGVDSAVIWDLEEKK